MTRNDQLRRLVIFAILMEHGAGIVAKSPDYIEEKHRLALRVPYPENLLDVFGRRKLRRWAETWRL